MKLSWLGKLMPYWFVKWLAKEYGKYSAILKIGHREFNVNLIFMDDKECGFWFSSSKELEKRKKNYQESINKVQKKINKIDSHLKKEAK